MTDGFSFSLDLNPFYRIFEIMKLISSLRFPDSPYSSQHVEIGTCSIHLHDLSDQKTHNVWLRLRPAPVDHSRKKLWILKEDSAIQVRVRFTYSKVSIL